MLTFALAFGLVACDDPSEPTRYIPGDAAPPVMNIEPLRLRLLHPAGLALTPGTGPFRMVAEEIHGQGRVESVIADEIESWPFDAELDALPAGTWRVTVFLDRGADGRYDGCPFPPEAGHTELADSLDNIVGVTDIQSGRAEATDVELTRRICGPGEVTTGIDGVLVRPDDPRLDGVHLRAMLVPEHDAERMDAEGKPANPMIRALHIPLFPPGVDAGPLPFRVGELVPGRYRLEIFSDDDGDRMPTTCALDGPGGGDRYAASVSGIEIVAGAFTALPGPVELHAAPCPEALTGVVGRIAAPGDGVNLEGALRIELTSPEGGPAVASLGLDDDLGGRALPHPFTVSGLPPGLWRLHVYIDADHDRRFSPCSGALAGFDTVYATVEDVVIAPDELLDLGRLELLPDGCPPSAGLAGTIGVDIEDGPLSSARPVRMALTPIDVNGEPRTVTLFGDHVTLDQTDGRFGRRIPAGRYRGRIYVDTDRNGMLGTCDVEPFGDRARSGAFEVELHEGEVFELDPGLRVETIGCPEPVAILAPKLALDAVWTAEMPVETLRLSVQEAGGWRAHYDLPLRPELGDEQSVDPIELLPGEYIVTAFVDGDGDGEVDRCDSPDPDPYQDRVALTLDAMNAAARPEMRPTACDR